MKSQSSTLQTTAPRTTIFKRVENLIQKIENLDINLRLWITTLLAIIIIRLGLESFSSGKFELYTLFSFPHFFLFFIALLLSIIFLIYLLTKNNIIKISKIGLIGWLILWIAPIVDLFISRGRERFMMGYIFDSPQNFLDRYLHFFGGSPTFGITYGMRVQIILACLFITLYVFVKTKNVLKTIITPICVYTLIFIYSILPSLLVALQKLSLNFDYKDILDVIFVPKSIWQISFSDPFGLFDTEMSLVLFFLTVIQLVIWYLIYDRKKLKYLFLYNLRYLRFLLQIFALFSGLYLGYKITEVNPDFSLFGILTLFSLFCSIFFVWLFSVGINDIYDLEIDKKSPANQKRILIQKIMTPQEYQQLNSVFLGLACLSSFILGLPFFSLILILSAFCFIYSSPPFRLRRWPIIATLIIAASILLAVFEGFMLFTKNQSLASFPHSLILLILVFFTLALNIKDIKDYKADKENKILTIPSILGLRKGRFVCGLLVLLSFLLFAVFLKNKLLLLVSFGFGILGFLLTYDRRSKEDIVFLLYSVYLILVFVMSL